jgi:hypothetical protein
MTPRQKGYVLLDSNLHSIQFAVAKRLESRLNNSNWKADVLKRIYGNRKDVPSTLNLDYNEFPIIARTYQSAFPSLGEDSDLFRLFAEIRDLRNHIAHHQPFNPLALNKLQLLMQKLFGHLHITCQVQDVQESEGNSKIETTSLPILETQKVNWEHRKNFIISERLKGKGVMICTEFQSGKHAGKKFLYSHDEVYDVCIDDMKDMPYWKTYSYYVSSTSIRKEALPFVKELS